MTKQMNNNGHRILIFSGTSEGRALSELLSKAGMAHGVCVVSDYGVSMGYDESFARVHRGVLDEEEMSSFIVEEGYDVILDATHPYARIAGDNIKKAASDNGALYLRLGRKLSCAREGLCFFDDALSCAKALSQLRGNILLTTGSKDLESFCKDESLRERLYVRVIPRAESLTKCEECKVIPSHIIAMHGPFSSQMNEAIIRQYDIEAMVSKQTGREGGFFEKVRAAQRTGIKLFVIGAPADEGEDMQGICSRLSEITGKKISSRLPMELIFMGMGMAENSSVTVEGYERLSQADVVIGSKRLLASKLIPPGCTGIESVDCDEIVSALKELYENAAGPLKVCLVFSGDISFYSACKRTRQAVMSLIERKEIEAELMMLPGVSALSYLAAKAGLDYSDTQIISLHGRRVPDLAERIEKSYRTFLLLSGLSDVKLLCAALSGMRVRLILGYELGTEAEEVIGITPGQADRVTKEGLYCCFVLGEDSKDSSSLRSSE